MPSSRLDRDRMPVSEFFNGPKLAVCATVTAAGDTTLYTPTANASVRLVWVTAINDPDEATSPLIKILLGTTELYRVYAVGHSEVFEGQTDEPLIVNLSGVASVAVTAHIQEFFRD